MRPGRIGTAALSLLLAGTATIVTPARAQDAPAALPRERTGPNATQPTLPAFASPPPPAPAEAASPPIDTTAGSIHIADVAIDADPAASAAIALPGWTTGPDAASGLALEHRAGEPLDAAWVRRQFAVNGMIGHEVGYDRIGALFQLINLAYLHNGYINSGVVLAPQPAGVSDGALHLRLVSGHLVGAAAGENPIIVSWKDGHADGLSADYLRHRMRDAYADPLNIQAIERDFRLLADDPAIRTTTASIRPDAHPGEASLALIVDPQARGDLYETVANSRSPSVGGERVAFGGYLRSTLSPGDVLSAEYGSTSGLTDFTGGYVAPLFGPDTTVQIHGGFNNAAVIDRPLAKLNITSKEYYVEGGLNRRLFARPLLPTGIPDRWIAAQEASAGILFIHRRVLSTLLGEPFSFSPGSDHGRTEYSAVRLTGDYTRRALNTVLSLSFTGTIGIEGTRDSLPGLISPSQHFTAMLLQANYARRLNPHRLELRLRFAGQAAGGILYSPERFSIGGAETVRGYRESVLLADEAAVASAELAQPLSLSGGRSGGGDDWTSFTISAFADVGIVHNRQGTQPTPTSIASIGASLVWTPTPWLSARFTFGQPLRYVRPTGDKNIQDRGFEFRVVLHPITVISNLFS